jgi:hypothetical protein
MQLSHLLLRQETDERHRLAQSCGIFVVPQHGGVERTVVIALCEISPLVVRRNPHALAFPAMEVRKDPGAYLARRETAHDRQRDESFELIQRVV